MSHASLDRLRLANCWHTYTNKIFINYLGFKCNWYSCTLDHRGERTKSWQIKDGIRRCTSSEEGAYAHLCFYGHRLPRQILLSFTLKVTSSCHLQAIELVAQASTGVKDSILSRTWWWCPVFAHSSPTMLREPRRNFVSSRSPQWPCSYAKPPSVKWRHCKPAEEE